MRDNYERKLKGDNHMLFSKQIESTDGIVFHENEMDACAKIANKMIDRDYPVAEIAKITGLSIDEVEKLK